MFLTALLLYSGGGGGELGGYVKADSRHLAMIYVV